MHDISLHFEQSCHRERECVSRYMFASKILRELPCGLAGGDSGRLYLWETVTGRLIRSFPGHFKSVTCVKFSQDGTLLISGGSDGLLRVWTIADIVSSASRFSAKDRPTTSGLVKPFRSWASHSLAVTGIYTSAGPAASASITTCSKL